MTDREDHRIGVTEHNKHPWRAHALLDDFDIEDVWQLTLMLSEDDDMTLVRDRIFGSLDEVISGGLPGVLFKIRLKMGQVFGWDEEAHTPVTLPTGSLRERYADQEGLTEDQMSTSTDEGFQPVYVLLNESLDELENATVHAGLHIGKVPHPDGGHRVQLAIYVKPKGKLGKAYMAGIKPFRHRVVYPAWLRHMEQM